MREFRLNDDVIFISFPVGSTFFIICSPVFKLIFGIGIINAVSSRIFKCFVNRRKCRTSALIIKIYSSFLIRFGIIFGNVIVHIFLVGNDTEERIFLNANCCGVEELIVGIKEHIPCFTQTFKACSFPCLHIADIYKAVGVGNTLVSLFTQLIHKVHILNIINDPADGSSIFLSDHRKSCIVAAYPAREFH